MSSSRVQTSWIGCALLLSPGRSAPPRRQNPSPVSCARPNEPPAQVTVHARPSRASGRRAAAAVAWSTVGKLAAAGPAMIWPVRMHDCVHRLHRRMGEEGKLEILLDHPAAWRTPPRRRRYSRRLARGRRHRLDTRATISALPRISACAVVPGHLQGLRPLIAGQVSVAITATPIGRSMITSRKPSTAGPSSRRSPPPSPPKRRADGAPRRSCPGSECRGRRSRWPLVLASRRARGKVLPMIVKSARGS